MAEWRVGVEGGGNQEGRCVCVWACVYWGWRWLKKRGNPPSPAHFQRFLVPWMVNWWWPLRWRSRRKTKTARGNKDLVTHQPPPDFLSIDCHTSDGWLVSIQAWVSLWVSYYSTHTNTINWLIVSSCRKIIWPNSFPNKLSQCKFCDGIATYQPCLLYCAHWGIPNRIIGNI